MKNIFKVSIVFFITLLLSSSFSIAIKINSTDYDNTPPNPPLIEGPTTTNRTNNTHYYMTVTDPDQHYLFELYVEFGDGTNETLKPHDSCCVKGWRSGQTLTVSHRWKETGSYIIRAKVKDFIGDWSDWGTYSIQVSKPKIKLKHFEKIDFNMLRLPNILKLLSQLTFSNILSKYL